MFIVHIVVDIFVLFIAGHFVKLAFQWVGQLFRSMSPEACIERRKDRERRLAEGPRIVERRIPRPATEETVERPMPEPKSGEEWFRYTIK